MRGFYAPIGIALVLSGCSGLIQNESNDEEFISQPAPTEGSMMKFVSSGMGMEVMIPCDGTIVTDPIGPTPEQGIPEPVFYATCEIDDGVDWTVNRIDQYAQFNYEFGTKILLHRFTDATGTSPWGTPFVWQKTQSGSVESHDIVDKLRLVNIDEYITDQVKFEAYCDGPASPTTVEGAIAAINCFTAGTEFAVFKVNDTYVVRRRDAQIDGPAPWKDVKTL